MKILRHPNPALSTASAAVDIDSDSTLEALAERMARAMYEAPGIGLAAPQIGVMKRIIVFDLSEDGSGLTALCNPVIVERGDETVVEEEGCLSLPGISVPIERSAEVVCEGTTIDGRPIRLEAEGLMARLFQHETDHLDGTLIIDRATPDERRAAMRRYREALEGGGDAESLG